MKEITFITGSLSGGGAERVVSLLAKKLSDRGYKVSIILLYSSKNNYLEDKNIKIYPIITTNKTKLGLIFNRSKKLYRTLKNLQPDLIISFDAYINLYSILCSRRLDIPIIVSERNDPKQFPNRIFIRKIRNKLYNYVDKVIFQTPNAQNYFTEAIQNKSEIIPNPIKSNLPYWKDNTHFKKIITASRLYPEKNIEMLIHAFSKIEYKYPEYTLEIFGLGPLKEELENSIYEKGLSDKVFLRGFSKEIHEEMANSSLFVLPSDREGISNSMLEALAIGVPVISTDSPIGGARMFIKQNTNGLLTKVRDTQELTEAIDKILSNPELRDKVSENSIKIREILNEEKITNKWEIIINEVLNRKINRK